MTKRTQKTKIEEWLDEESLSPAIEESPQRRYSEKMVAWIDILGIRRKIKNVGKYDAEAIFLIMEELHATVIELCDKYVAKNEMHYMQIADGVLIVAELALAKELCDIIAEIQWRILVNQQMLARGAITKGPVSVSHTNIKIIGPAYVDVYEFESENAIYARVILTDNVITHLKTVGDSLPGYIVEDADEIYYIDYIEFIKNKFSLNSKKVLTILKDRKVLHFLKDGVNDKNLKVRQKYGWTEVLLKNNGVVLNDK